MIYYALTTLMSAGIREVLIISTPQDTPRFAQLLGDGSQWGINLKYVVQPSSYGLAQAFIIGSEFIGGDNSALELGDKIFYGNDFYYILQNADQRTSGPADQRTSGPADQRTSGPADQRTQSASVFPTTCMIPRATVSQSLTSTARCSASKKSPKILSPTMPSLVSTVHDSQIVDLARNLKPSPRGELEIIDLNRPYLEKGQLSVEIMGRGYARLDTGTHDSMLEAGQFIATIEKRQGLKVACPEVIAFRQGWIGAQQLEAFVQVLAENGYGQYFIGLIKESRR